MAVVNQLPPNHYHQLHSHDSPIQPVSDDNKMGHSMIPSGQPEILSAADDTSLLTALFIFLLFLPEPSLAQGSMVSSIQSQAMQESLSGFVAGAALTCTKTLVKYPLDTATVRLQMPNSIYSIRRPLKLFQNSFQGILNPLLWNIPGGAVFFAVKDAVKSMLREVALGRWEATCLAVLIANFPYWLIRNPSEVVKTKQQANLVDEYSRKTAWEAFQLEFQQNGLQGLYKGYWENILYATPADWAKFLIYEQLTATSSGVVSPLEGAVAGAVATATAQWITTPLDVIRNRVMARNDDSTPPAYLDHLRLLYEQEGWNGLLAGAWPRVGKAILSGAIQFATYEETKQQIMALFIPTQS
jgi:solute carrier family 25 S-adenosylmethionine transporter 26